MTHEYLMEIQQYFGGRLRFQVTAESREEALDKARDYLNERRYDRDNRIEDSLRVVKKLKPSFGNES